MLPFITILPIIEQALREDIGTGDITTSSTVPANSIVTGQFIAKQKGVVCGLPVAEAVFSRLDPTVRITPFVSDGAAVMPDGRIASITGPAGAILSGERVALNFLQRLSGIATKTAELVVLLKDTDAVVCDTRKTTPGLRVLEKYAVRTGGGRNHRMNLSDGILIKDNHIRAAGGIGTAIKRARANAPATLKIEVETEDLAGVREALEAGADIIMLDNMGPDEMKEAVRIINGRALVEASGNIDRNNLRDVAHCGVDMISMGALTHSVPALDISLRLD